MEIEILNLKFLIEQSCPVSGTRKKATEAAGDLKLSLPVSHP